jgi:hypothetical protein
MHGNGLRRADEGFSGRIDGSLESTACEDARLFASGTLPHLCKEISWFQWVRGRESTQSFLPVEVIRRVLSAKDLKAGGGREIPFLWILHSFTVGEGGGGPPFRVY